MSQLQVTGEAKIRDIQGPVVANDGVVTALDGAASQYVRGDGTLADFPTSSGGGSSVSYYLNSSVSQGTIGGVAYRELSKDPIIGAGTDIAISSNGYVASYITDANDPDVVLVPGGNFNCEFYFSVNNNSGNPFTYAELYKYDGTTFTLLGSSVGVPEYINQGTIIAPYYFAIPVATAALALTDRLAIRIYVNVDGRTVTLHTENGHLCQVVTTLSKGMVSLNNLTDQSQYLTTGTAGTNFAIVSSGDTHTFNLPVASAANTGKLSSTDWSTFNNKIAGTGTTNYLSKFTSASAIGNSLVYDNGTNVIIGNGTTDIQGRLQVTTSAGALLLNTDNINFAILFRNTSSSNKLWDISSFNNDLVFNEGGVGSRLYLKAGGDVGIGNTTPAYKLDVSGTGRFTGELRLDSTITNGTFTYTLPAATGTLALTSQLTSGTVTSVGLSSATSGVTIGSSPITTSGTITLAIATASGSLNGLLSSTDWTTFNSKQNALTNPVTGTGLAGAIPKFTTTGSTIGSSIIYDSGTQIGINTLSPTATLEVNGTLKASGVVTLSSTITASSLIKSGGTSAQILAADGSVITAGTNITISGGTISSTGAITGSGTTNYVTKFTGASSIGNSLIFDNGTNVGIGQISPSYKLDVQDNGVSGIVDVASFSVTGNGGSGRGVGILIGAAGSSNSVQVARLVGYQELANPVAVAASFAIQVANASGTLTERLRITQAGNLLIGSTTDNGSRLQVNGTTSGDLLYLDAGINTDYAFKIVAAANDVLTLRRQHATVGALDIISFGFNGNVGIGSSAPSEKLQVLGNLRFTGNNITTANTLISEINAYAGSSNQFKSSSIKLFTGTFVDQGYITFNTSISGADVERMRIAENGSILVGASSIAAAYGSPKLFVVGGSNPLTLANGDNTGTYLQFNTGAANGVVNLQADARTGAYPDLTFTTGATERMRITTLGTVAINTSYSNATYKLVTKVGTDKNIAFGIQNGECSIECFNDAVNASVPLQIYNSILYLPGQANDTTSSLANMVIDSTTGRIQRSTTSSQRFKKNINDWTGSGLDTILALKPKTFNYKEEYYNKTNNDFLGLIAEEVAEVSSYLADYENEDRNGQVENVRYANIVVPLIKAIQEQQAQIEELKALINK